MSTLLLGLVGGGFAMGVYFLYACAKSLEQIHNILHRQYEEPRLKRLYDNLDP